LLDGALHGEEGYAMGLMGAHAAPTTVAEQTRVPAMATESGLSPPAAKSAALRRWRGTGLP